MTKRNQDIDDYHAGDTLEIVVTVTDDDGNIIDITGADVEWYLLQYETSPDEDHLLKKTTTDGGITVTSAQDGEFTVTVDAGDTDGMSGEYHHRARMTDSTGNRSTVMTGTITIRV